MNRGIRVNFQPSFSHPSGISYEIDPSSITPDPYSCLSGYQIPSTTLFPPKVPVPSLTPVLTCAQNNDPIVCLLGEQPLYLFRPLISPCHADHPSQAAVYELFQNFNPEWAVAIETGFRQHGFIVLANFVHNERLAQGRAVYPPQKDVFNWTKTSPRNTKVVIMGQEPYSHHGANGLCFSVPKGVHMPQSLQNIYTEAGRNNVGFDIPNHGDLSSWAEEGVLLLNAALTKPVITVPNMREEKHNKVWEPLIHAVLSWLINNNNGAVFMLWGNDAQDWMPYITNHYILYAPNPCQLSAYTGFFGCNHFFQSNVLLKHQVIPEIKWTIPMAVYVNGMII